MLSARTGNWWIGDVPTWIQAVGTVFALLIAAFAYRSDVHHRNLERLDRHAERLEERQRHRMAALEKALERARTITFNAGGSTVRPGFEKVYYPATINNRSDQPITDLVLYYVDTRGPEIFAEVAVQRVEPRTVYGGAGVTGPIVQGPGMVVLFSDPEGNRFYCDMNGVVRFAEPTDPQFPSASPLP